MPADAVRGMAAAPIGELLHRVRQGASSAQAELQAALASATAHGAPAAMAPEGGASDPVWLHHRPADDLAAEAQACDAQAPHRPLHGVPVAIKGNIDVAGLPTTAACPTFATAPAATSATAVQRLAQAGALILGTTNLDQFATGLSGARSPYGVPACVADPTRISGGSSSGSAIAVARGDVPLALGTDTAGSGRVPAALNGIVGLKPSRGLISTAGVLPACRSLDVVSIFTADVASAAHALGVLAAPDPGDPYSRDPAPLWPAPTLPQQCTIGVPRALPDAPIDPEAQAAWERTLEHIGALPGITLIEIDCEPLLEAGRQLYGGAFVAERYASVGAFIEHEVQQPHAESSLDPTVRELVLAGAGWSAAQAFSALTDMQARTRAAHAQLAACDALLTPTVLEHPTIEAMLADPIVRNARLGHYTTFGNLLDLSVLALPGLPREDGLPFGLSLHAPAFHEPMLLELGASLERSLAPRTIGDDAMLLAVCGAHMAGLPANPELTELGGSFVALTRTAATYRMHLLQTPAGPRPGLQRGAAAPPIEVELWSLPRSALGALAGRVPQGLALGAVQLLGGEIVTGFVAAADRAITDAPELAGWRAHVLGLQG